MDEALLDGLLRRYGSQITCVCFMGGDQDPKYVLQMAEYVKQSASSNLQLAIKTAWYSGRPSAPTDYDEDLTRLDFVKFGPYIEALGGLKSPTTNQRLYKQVGEGWEDITPQFYTRSF